MVVFETSLENKYLLDELSLQFDNDFSSNKYTINSLDGNDVVQVLLPLSYIIAPLVAKTVQKLFSNDNITIKFDGIEISGMGYKKAMKMLNEIHIFRTLDEGDDIEKND